MDGHYGKTVERTVRRNGHSITEVANLINVNRRSVYNWFNQQKLKPEIIYRIGCALNHDFSIEFPQIFSPADFNIMPNLASIVPLKSKKTGGSATIGKDSSWRDKYINLLERFNILLENSPGYIQNHINIGNIISADLNDYIKSENA